MRRMVKWAACGFGMLLFLSLVLRIPWAAWGSVCWGWIPAGARVARSFPVEAAAGGLFLLAVAVLLMGTHAFACWLGRSMVGASGSECRPVWRWRWTLLGFGLAGCFLMALLAGVLMVHQFYWLRASKYPWTADDSLRWNLAYNSHQLHAAAEDLHWETAALRSFFESGFLHGKHGEPIFESLQAVWIPQDSQKLKAFILFPRRPLVDRWSRVAVAGAGIPIQFLEMRELPRALAMFGIKSDAGASGLGASKWP